MNTRLKQIACTLGVALLLTSTHVIADEVKTDGGFEVYRSDDDRYWFKLHGIAKVDAIFFGGDFEDKEQEFPNGTNIRALETTFNGGIGKDLSYTIVLGYESGTITINDTFFTYAGFKETEISVGQIISPFCLENANSAKWIPFLERSLPVVALRPCMGIGVNLTTWGKHYGIIFASATVPHGQNRDTNIIQHRSDRLTNTLRAFYVPINNDNKVFQIGASGVYASNNPTFRNDSPNTDGRRFATRPEVRARNTPNLVNSGSALLVDNYNEYAFEISGQRGPLVVGAEYLHAYINRWNNPGLDFYGWHAQAAYVLTGESRIYKIKNGSYGQIIPKCPYGAFEIAARYSMVDLNDEDIHGGKENNVSLSLSWYVNEHLLILANYIHASIDPTQALGNNLNPNPNHRQLNIFGIRSQIVW
ncbi:MAG: OprO/OprP family phosphate-selective porin [Candidatus Berkiella sp.]